MGFCSVVEGPHGFLFSGGGSSWVSVQWWRIPLNVLLLVFDHGSQMLNLPSCHIPAVRKLTP